MADGTERRNIAEKKKVNIKIKFSKIDNVTLSSYLTLMEGDFEAEYYSPKYHVLKTQTFRLIDKPDISLIGTYIDLYEEFQVEMESI